jgi:hypothetical protein
MNEFSALGYKTAGAGEKLTYGASSTVTATVCPPAANGFRIVSTTDVQFDIGPSPVALATSGRILPAYVPEARQARPGDLVAVIQVSGAGTVYVEPIIIGNAGG